jgi:hypothetical protein
MPDAVRLHRIAERFLGRLGPGKATRLVLSLFFKAVLGIQRVFHFETINDLGFAILTGGKTVLSRTMLGGLVRAAPVKGVLRFVRETQPALQRSDGVTVSIDEHVLARFTRKFAIRKGFHTIRNKHMKVEKLFYPFVVGGRKLLSLIVTRGNSSLAAISQTLLGPLRRQTRGRKLRVILDAGAALNHERLLALAQHPRQVTLVRTPRKAAYRQRWAKLPASAWQRVQEPGPFKKAPPKTIYVAETRMPIGKKKPCAREVRTIVVREQARRGKERWHAIWVFNDESTAPLELVREFRSRQHHEQVYRILLHDAFVDTAPSGYNKKSPNVKRPGFKQNALTLYAWMAALAANALDAFSRNLPRRFLHAHPRTLRRWLFNIDADLFLGHDTLIVLLRPRRLQHLWLTLVRTANRRRVRIPWLENRRLILALPKQTLRPEGAFDPRSPLPGVWC